MIKFNQLLVYMLNRKDIYVPMEDEQFKKVQDSSFEMMKAIQDVCEKHHINMMLGFGSALGAVRHEGFIPWDDDIDIIMPRADYDRFIEICEKELPENYLVYTPKSSKGPEIRSGKVFNSLAKVFPQGSNENSNLVFVDIFPLENYDNCWLRRKFKWGIYLILSVAATTTRLWHDRKMDTDYSFAMKLSRRGRIEYSIRLAIGFLFSFWSYQQWLLKADRLLSTTRESDQVFVPSIFYYTKPIQKDIMLPPSTGVFNGHKVYLPHNPEAFLELVYGDWKKLPPIEQRRQHNYYRIRNKE